MSSLNPQQLAAIRYIDGPLLVLAGAGSGKTRVITQKIAYLIEQCDYAAASICALTFTNKAAREMQHRLGTLLPSSRRRGMTVSTFHALGLAMLKREAVHCGLTKQFSIFDTEDCLQILRGLIPPACAQDRAFLLKIQQRISAWKSDLLLPEQTTAIDEETSLYYQQYQTTLRAYNSVDFDDLIALPVILLQDFPEVLAYWQQKFRHILVDEYQDSNSSQYRLLCLLMGGRAKLTAVGDDDQSIYAWRGAKPENLVHLQRDFPELKVITLEQNYRSTGQILHIANQLISNNPKLFTKKLWSEFGPGDMVRVLSCKDEQDEAELVIADMISHKLRHGRSYRDYALLYRSNHQSRIFETVLRAQGIPYHISGGQSWFGRAEVKDWFAYLKILCNEADDAAFLRVITTPKRGIGEVTLRTLGDYAKSRNQSLFTCCDHLALSDRISESARALLTHFKQTLLDFKRRAQAEPIVAVLRDMVDHFAYETYIYEQSDTPQQAQKRMDNVWQLIDWVGSLFDKKEENTLSDVVNTMILIDILDKSEDNDAEVVQLMTLHAAKGLEFPCVYLVGMEDGILPHQVSIDDNQIEEERRLAYVGITRAKQVLTLSLSRRRRRGGEVSACLPSRFLDELPQENLEWFGREIDRDEQKSKALAQSHLAGLKSMLASRE